MQLGRLTAKLSRFFFFFPPSSSSLMCCGWYPFRKAMSSCWSVGRFFRFIQFSKTPPDNNVWTPECCPSFFASRKFFVLHLVEWKREKRPTSQCHVYKKTDHDQTRIPSVWAKECITVASVEGDGCVIQWRKKEGSQFNVFHDFSALRISCYLSLPATSECTCECVCAWWDT